MNRRNGHTNGHTTFTDQQVLANTRRVLEEQTAVLLQMYQEMNDHGFVQLTPALRVDLRRALWRAGEDIQATEAEEAAWKRGTA